MTDDTKGPLSQDEFLKAKKALDYHIAGLGKLIKQAEAAMQDCCTPGLLDTRDQFADLAGHLTTARGALMHARAQGGRIEGAGIARSGGT